MFTIKEIYDLAIQIEKNGEAFYLGALKGSPHPDLIPLFQWLAEEEVQHQKWFSQKKDSLKNPLANAELENAGKEILGNILGDQSFSLNEADLSKIDEIDALLELAIEFEEDTIVFFQMIRALVDDYETLEQLNEIIEEENRHVRMLHEALKNRAEGTQGLLKSAITGRSDKSHDERD